MSSSRRGEHSLSIRLQSLADYYHGQEEVWDIGCDHGLLGLSFQNIETVKEIYLVDPSELVIKDLQLKLIDSHIPVRDILLKLHVLHQTGQSLKLSPFSKCIFIAGMGGKEIGEILSHLISQISEKDRIVISPHRKILELRQHLSSMPLGLKEEAVIEENDQFYQIMVLEKCSDLPKTSLYGTDLWHGRTGLRYLEREKRNFMIHQDEISRRYVQYLEDIIAEQGD